MDQPIKVFISYRNLSTSRNAGWVLQQQLEDAGLAVFFDQTRLKPEGGVQWENRLRQEAESADVMLVLLEEKTYESDWVKKEINIARTSLGTVIPLAIVDDTALIGESLGNLDLDDLQYLRHTPENPQVLIDAIQTRGLEVRERRKRHEEWKKGTPSRFLLPDARGAFEFFLMSDDATEVKGYDVIVNSENVYMQMGRFYETRTLSSVIRRKGSYIREEYILEDTVQEQLNHQVKHGTLLRVIPVQQGQILVTEGGHPQSELVRTGFRYIFHAASVMVDRHEGRIDPIPLSGFQELVRNCLRKVDEVNEAAGCVVYDSDGNLLQPANFRPLHSILFPLFGTGEGKHPVIDAAREIIASFVDCTTRRRNPKTALNRIGLCVFDPMDADLIATEFQRQHFVQR